MLNERTILVTGASGFIGKHLVARLIGLGATVKLLVRDASRLSDEFSGKCDVIVGSLENEVAIKRALVGVDTVFHCAGNVRTWDSRSNYFAANVEGVRRLVKLMSELGEQKIRLVHLSTVDVYGFPSCPCNELSKTDGGGFGYGESKLMGERVVRELCEKAALPFTIIRPGNVIGPESQFIARIGVELESGLMLKVGGGRAHAGLVYIDNLLDLLLWAAESDVAIGQCYNVRDPYEVTWGEFMDRFRSGIGGKGWVINLPFHLAEGVAQAFEICHRYLMPTREPLLHRLLVRIFGRTCGHSSEKIFADSGYRGRIGFDEAMERSIRWFIDNRPSRH